MNRNDPRVTKIAAAPSGSPTLRGWSAQLVVETGSRAGTSFTLKEERVTIGRSPEADVVLDDERVSRVHAEIVVHAGGHWVRDLQSTNGTVVNGEPVKEASLAHGDRVAIGSHELRYIVDDVLSPRIYEIP
jgi:pSer/pThr/pTyr-binding forkhead associated (FHA) protein